MTATDIRSAKRPDPDPVLRDIADYVCDATIDSEVFIRLVRSGQVGLTGDALVAVIGGQGSGSEEDAAPILTTLGVTPGQHHLVPQGCPVLDDLEAEAARAADHHGLHAVPPLRC